MSDNPTGLLPVFGYVATVVLSVPVAVAALALARFRDVRVARALRWLGLTVGVVALVGGVAVAVVADPSAGAFVLAGTLLGALAFAVLPLTVARWLVAGLSGGTPESSLRYAVVGWPVGLAASLAVFVAPGGAARYNLTFLDGPAAVVGWTAWAACVLLVPGLAGALAARVRTRGATRPAR